MSAIIIERQKPVGKVVGRGRRPGSGGNQKLLSKLAPGDSLWDVPEAKMHSLRTTAARAGVKLKIRRIPDTDLYSIEVLP